MTKNELYVAIALALGAAAVIEVFKPVLRWTGRTLFAWIISLNATLESNYYKGIARRNLSLVSLLVFGFVGTLLLVLLTLIFLSPTTQPEERQSVARIVVATVLLCSIGFWIEALVLSNVQRALSLYDQLLAIMRPHMTDLDARLLNARFAQISGKSDYWSIINTLVGIGRDYSIVLPDLIARTLRYNSKSLSSTTSADPTQ